MALAPRAGNRIKGALPAGRESDGQPAPQSPVSVAQSRREDLALMRDSFALTDRYYKTIFNLLYQWIGDHEEAADLTQDTFTAAWKARDQFRGDARLYTWLYRIAHNNYKNRIKQRVRQREMEGPSLDAGVGADDGDEGALAAREVADWSYSPSQLLEQKEMRALVEKAIDSLAPEYKVVLILREMEDLTYNEIVEVTGLTLEAVKTRLNRARAMVRQRVEPYLKH
jgi:RNA polymerase sigma-70 factor (ECF subfamily)